MADEKLSDTFNPFGLTDSRTLEAKRRERLLAEQAQRRNQLSGMDFAGAETGAAFGALIARGFQRDGLMKDKEKEDALEVDKAAKRAQAAYNGIPSELREKDAFGVGIQRRQTLVRELDSAGLHSQADTVRAQIISLREQQVKFDKLQGETRKTNADADQAKFELQQTKDGLREKDEITRLQNAYGMLDLMDPVQAARADQIAARIDKLTAITGTTEYDERAADKVTLRKVEQSMFENQMTLDGFIQSQDSFDPSFLTLGGQIKNWAFKAADIVGFDLPDETKQQLAAFTTFRQNTSMNLNAYIKAITGAQMSNPEALRLKKDVPTMDDSPVEYKRKLDNIVTKLHAVRQRSLAAMEYTDDRKAFMEAMTTPLESFMPKAKNEIEPTRASDALVQEAEAALAELEAMMGQ